MENHRRFPEQVTCCALRMQSYLVKGSRRRGGEWEKPSEAEEALGKAPRQESIWEV